MSKRKKTIDEVSEDGNVVPILNKCYLVDKRIDGKVDKLVATVVHKEVRCPLKSKTAEEMYYVHYEKLDRRNDEWVTKERIRLSEGIVEPPAANTIVVPEEVAKKEGTVGGVRDRGAMTRSVRKQLEEYGHIKPDPMTNMDATTARLEMEHVERTKIKNVPQITIGAYTISAWYYSPFPQCYQNMELFMCEYCLLYTSEKSKFKAHVTSCKMRQPPGNEIYRKDDLSVYEVDGSTQKLYCQCLCLLSKLFMDHKTLYFDVDDFMFYVLCEVDTNGAHIVGYFSREVESANNLACIMVFPPFQKKGYGKLLIQLSYELSQREGYVGTPEKPLSDLGKVSYRSYWWWQIMKLFVVHQGHTITASFLSSESGIAVDDIVSTLLTMKVIKQYREPEFDPNEWYVRVHKNLVEYCLQAGYGKPPRLLLDKSQVRWAPAMTRYEYDRQNRRQGGERRASKSQSATPLPTPPIESYHNQKSALGIEENVASPQTSDSPVFDDSMA